MKSALFRVIALLVVLAMVAAPVSAQNPPPAGSRLPVVDRSTLLNQPEA
jgi:hypothetical protein